MRVIVAGSRSIRSTDIVAVAIRQSGFKLTQILSGTARGVDSIGEELGATWKVPVVRYPANWRQYGKGAGYKRNIQMAANADALVAVWDGQSRGTKHMIEIARAKGLQVYVLNLTNATNPINR